jgi:hypothetical protein
LEGGVVSYIEGGSNSLTVEPTALTFPQPSQLIRNDPLEECGVPDIDGDGFLDALVQTTLATDGGLGLWFYRGSDSGLRGAPDLEFERPTDVLFDNRFDVRIARSAGDVDGDGRPDVVLNLNGRLYQIPGVAGGPLPNRLVSLSTAETVIHGAGFIL